MSRQVTKRNQYKRYVVLGDGQTEQYYLEHLKSIGGYKYSVRPLLFHNITIEKAASLIKDLLEDGYDMVIYLTDYDTIVNQNKVEVFKKLTGKYKNSPKVLICETMPSIEFWFLLHYQKTTREFRNAEETTCMLLRYIRDYSKEESFLRKSKWVEDMCSEGKLAKAIEYAIEILKQKESGDMGSHFPYSKTHLAIEKFTNQISR